MPTAFAKWSKEAFEADSFETAMKEVFGTAETETSEKIKIKAPKLAENGALVPITIKSEIESTEAMSIFITSNPVALAANFRFGKKWN